MKLKLTALAAAALCSSAFAGGVYKDQAVYFPHHRLAIQGAIATGGTLGIGVVNYTEHTELGLTGSGTRNNATAATNSFTPVLFGGLRYNWQNGTYFAWGLDLVSTFGTDAGQHIDSSYRVGPYISLEQMMTYHIMLAGWIEPYRLSYVKKNGRSTTTNDFFNTGGVAINYLF